MQGRPPGETARSNSDSGVSGMDFSMVTALLRHRKLIPAEISSCVSPKLTKPREAELSIAGQRTISAVSFCPYVFRCGRALSKQNPVNSRVQGQSCPRPPRIMRSRTKLRGSEQPRAGASGDPCRPLPAAFGFVVIRHDVQARRRGDSRT